MTNDDFRAYIKDRVAWIEKTITDPDATPEEVKRAKQAKPLFENAQRMAKYSGGEAFRRFRRDFERRMKL